METNSRPCGSCNAPILFVPSAATGNVMPLEPCETGNIVVLDGKAHVKKGELFDETLPTDLPRYQSHYVTCPAAKKYRKSAK